MIKIFEKEIIIAGHLVRVQQFQREKGSYLSRKDPYRIELWCLSHNVPVRKIDSGLDYVEELSANL